MQILRKPDGGSRGFGFVTYKDEMSVEKCLVMQHSLSGKTVELKRAVKKEEMGGGGGGMGGMGMGGGYGMGGGSGTSLAFTPLLITAAANSLLHLLHFVMQSCALHCKTAPYSITHPDIYHVHATCTRLASVSGALNSSNPRCFDDVISHVS